jgi:beta-fructofuranosidase
MADAFAQDNALLERRRRDPHRPRYHFLPPYNWLNDPNGVIQFRGEYHLFYQYNPHGPLWGDIHWGHAVSRDLVHWEHLPVALAPTPGTYDERGCWSGCAVDNDGTPVIIYTGVRGEQHEQQCTCVAFGDAQLRTLTKHPGNPVLPDLPAGLDLVQYRDPCVWREADGWYMVVGSGITGVGGTALLYRSPDLLSWEYLHPLCVGDVRRQEPYWTGTMWECPDFFPLGDKYALTFSAWDGRALYPGYAIGTYADHRFTIEREGVADYGRWYAQQSFEDEQGRRIVWSWLRERRSDAAQESAGWSGVMALPRVYTLLPDGDLGSTPAPELETLRGQWTRLAQLTLAPGGPNPLIGLCGDCLEIMAEFAPGDATQFGLVVRRSPGGEEETRIVYDRASARLRIDRSRSTLDPESDPTSPEAPCPLASDGTLRLRVFLDRSVLEVFANERVCFGERIYPSRPDSLGLALFAEGGSAELRALDAWEMGSIWDKIAGPE